MPKKLATIDLKGKAYATVPVRIKEFREDCPNGLIDPKPEFLADGRVMFSVRILKDKANPNSGEATGHSIGNISKEGGDKGFEKLETIATGRALALLGYMASGDVASSEEMEEFTKFQEEKDKAEVAKFKDKLQKAKDSDELKKVWASVPAKAKIQLTKFKDELKQKYENPKV